jgi:hypothetical protein
MFDTIFDTMTTPCGNCNICRKMHTTPNTHPNTHPNTPSDISSDISSDILSNIIIELEIYSKHNPQFEYYYEIQFHNATNEK